LIEREAAWGGSPESVQYRPAKGVFIGLLAFCALILVLTGFFFWYIPSVGLTNIHPALPAVFGIGLAAIILIFVAGAVGLSLAIIKGKDIFLSYKFRGILIKFFLPLMVMIGGLLNTEDKDRAVFHRDKQPACQGDGETVQAGEDSYTHAALHSVYGLQDKGDTECKKLCRVRQV